MSRHWTCPPLYRLKPSGDRTEGFVLCLATHTEVVCRVILYALISCASDLPLTLPSLCTYLHDIPGCLCLENHCQHLAPEFGIVTTSTEFSSRKTTIGGLHTRGAPHIGASQVATYPWRTKKRVRHGYVLAGLGWIGRASCRERVYVLV